MYYSLFTQLKYNINILAAEHKEGGEGIGCRSDRSYDCCDQGPARKRASC